jgi:NAD(P)-dependent dehydrogenase (short-subunit alcohol dehydrogenase family)
MVAGMMDAKARAQRAAASALGTEGTARDVAWAAVFLASDEARWITGATLPVDGGMSQTNPLAIHRTLEALEAEEESS